MTILGYSGRGEGRGGGRGRGREWGRGGVTGRGGPSHPHGGGRGRGRFQPARGGNASSQSHKWVRTDESDGVSSGPANDEKSTQENSFVKRGKNQLILKPDAVKKPASLNSEKQGELSINSSLKNDPKSKTNHDPGSGTSETHEATDVSNKQMAGGARNNSKSDAEPLLEKESKKEVDKKDHPSQSSISLRKVAPNKLVVSGLKKSNGGDNNSVLGAGNKGPTIQMTKIASNKLVAPGAHMIAEAPPASRPNHYHGQRSWPGQGPKKRPPPVSRKPHPSAKRIAIEVTNKQSGDADEDQADPDTTANGESSNEPTEKLTDFAYRETSRRVQRGNESKSLKWSATAGSSNANSSAQQSQRPVRRNMGLVRVQPNMDKTPICKKFLRGIICTDQYCKKRHDVPKEFAMPVCSFFQRHGNCLKGDECPFRHIKVNPRAMVCPSFAVLGFCDDPECKMKHERSMPRNK